MNNKAKTYTCCNLLALNRFEHMKDKLVYLIILNWNAWKETVECVESCLKLTYTNCRILIVDNGSTDSSESILRERFPFVVIIQTGENLGFAGGNNVGIRYALRHGADYTWLLNNDTVVDSEALGELLKIAESDTKIGVVGSKIYYYNRPDILWFAGGRITRLAKLVHHLGLNQADTQLHQENLDVDFITGCSILVRSATIQQVGLMREEYFLYGEDVDWNIRIKKAGWKIKWAASSKLWHKVSSGHGEGNPFLNYYVVRNILQYVRLNKPYYLPFTLAALLYSNIMRKLLGFDFIGIKWSISGFRDFFAGRLGMYKIR